MHSGVVSVDDINNNTNCIGIHVINGLNVDSILQIGVDFADKNNFITTKEDILNGKINSVIIENRNSTDGRSFYSYFETIDGIFVKFTDSIYNPKEEVNERNGYQMLGDTFSLLPTNIDKIEIQIPENKRKNLKQFFNNLNPLPTEKKNLVIIIKGKCKNTIEEGNEFQLRVTANSLLTLTRK